MTGYCFYLILQRLCFKGVTNSFQGKRESQDRKNFRPLFYPITFKLCQIRIYMLLACLCFLSHRGRQNSTGWQSSCKKILVKSEGDGNRLTGKPCFLFYSFHNQNCMWCNWFTNHGLDVTVLVVIFSNLVPVPVTSHYRFLLKFLALSIV